MKKLLRIKSFTLIELMVVIAIIAVLAVIIAPQALKAVEKARISAVLGDYQAIKTGAFSFNADTATWPANDCGEESFTTNDNCSGGTYTGWAGPYLEKWPNVARWQGSEVYWCKVTSAAISPCEAWNTDASDEERYIRITNVPLTSAQRLDEQVDGSPADGTADWVRYTTGSSTTTLRILVSED